ncbi:hypothetical protein ACFU7Y_36365 [Kitasatospora sp. NPDC057542]|uniref:hypothetical protein n=1 Tax=Kitasatospora sp. NPDC057542 TaxID=3346162 RepID=UPI0036A54177
MNIKRPYPQLSAVLAALGAAGLTAEAKVSSGTAADDQVVVPAPGGSYFTICCSDAGTGSDAHLAGYQVLLRNREGDVLAVAYDSSTTGDTDPAPVVAGVVAVLQNHPTARAEQLIPDTAGAPSGSNPQNTYTGFADPVGATRIGHPGVYVRNTPVLAVEQILPPVAVELTLRNPVPGKGPLRVRLDPGTTGPWAVHPTAETG